VRKRKKVIIFLAPIICFGIIWVSALARCEFLTLIYGNEFSNQTLYKENTMIGDMEYIKILDCSKNHARIYYISEGNSLGSIIEFVKIDDKWKYNKWEDALWSTSGNADRIIWPYWWHFLYFIT